MNSVIFCNPVILHKFLLEALNTDSYFLFSASNKDNTTIVNLHDKRVCDSFLYSLPYR